MTIKSGTKAAVQDRKDYSYNRTFGVVTPEQLPDEFSVDAGLWMPNQNADGNPYSCTAYSVCDVGSDQDGLLYSPAYAYCKNLFMQGLPPETNGSDLRPALKQPKIYGLLPNEDVPEILQGKGEDFTADQSNWPTGVDAIAGKLEHRKGSYFNVYDDGGLDWYDAIKSAIWMNRADKRGVILGTPWLWFSAPQGFLSPNFVYNGDPRSVSWHAWNIKGWTMIDGKQYLIGKPWQGKEYGANGWVYVSRETINKVMPIRGAIAFTLADATAADIKSIQFGILGVIVDFIARLLRIKLLA